MAYVLIDVSACDDKNYGSTGNWFRSALDELATVDKNVLFIYPRCQKYEIEIDKCPTKVIKLAIFLREMRKIGKRHDLTAQSCDAEIKKIESLSTWKQNKKCCDDAHIFSIAELVPNFFLFTRDVRLATCKKKLQRDDASRRYTRFTVIKEKEEYEAHKHFILV